MFYKEELKTIHWIGSCVGSRAGLDAVVSSVLHFSWVLVSKWVGGLICRK